MPRVSREDCGAKGEALIEAGEADDCDAVLFVVVMDPQMTFFGSGWN